MDSEIHWKTCAKQGCLCDPRINSKYCSDYCEQNKDRAEETCSCGHIGCGAIGILKPGPLTPQTA
ncbi:MAG TPA: hypothetical protein VKG25_22920 [Bryobacteraceae bacterium]|nr:hypothetical protein [Bryobacteraceae bacterium]